MKKKKIMQFIYGLNTGGAETLVKNYMLNFDQEKFDVVLLCLGHSEKSPYEKELAENGVRVIYASDDLVMKKNKNKRLKKVVNHFWRYIAVRRTIREEAPDVLHTHMSINLYVKLARPRIGTVIFHTVHNEPKRVWPSKRTKERKDFKAAKWLVKKYKMRFIALHDEMRKEINERFGVSNTIVLNNGIDKERFKDVKDEVQERKENGIPESAFVIGHVGRFSAQKNHEFLIKIFAEIKKRNNRAFLLMIGDGERRSEIENELCDMGLKNDYLILSNRNDVVDLLSAMDVFVFPSRYEGLSVAMIEAQEAQKPCFISDTISDYTIISNLVTKLSIEHDAKEWADVIVSYKKPNEVIINDEDWDIKQITKKLEQIYLEALAEKQDGKK